MQIVQLLAQIQCQLQDGSTIVLSVPVNLPDKELTIDKIKEKIEEFKSKEVETNSDGDEDYTPSTFGPRIVRASAMPGARVFKP